MKKCIKAFIALSGTALLLLPQTAYACERCFGAGANGPVVQAISLSMLALLVMTVVVWGGIVTFFGNMEKRSKMLASGELVVLDNGKVVPATVAHAADRPAREVLDDLLDKINKRGYKSLTPEEKILLDELSQ